MEPHATAHAAEFNGVADQGWRRRRCLDAGRSPVHTRPFTPTRPHTPAHTRPFHRQVWSRAPSRVYMVGRVPREDRAHNQPNPPHVSSIEGWSGRCKHYSTILLYYTTLLYYLDISHLSMQECTRHTLPPFSVSPPKIIRYNSKGERTSPRWG